MLKNQKGVTLVALIVTIIILLILAGVAIATLGGTDGIFRKAREAADATNNAAEAERNMLNDASDYINSMVNGVL